MSTFIRNASLIALALVPLTTASATTVIGNPSTGITSVGPGSIYVDELIAKPCGGASQVIDIGATVSKFSPLSVDLGQDEWCSLYLNVKWTAFGPTVMVKVGGFTTYETLSGEDAFVLSLNASVGSAVLALDTGKS